MLEAFSDLRGGGLELNRDTGRRPRPRHLGRNHVNDLALECEHRRARICGVIVAIDVVENHFDRDWLTYFIRAFGRDEDAAIRDIFLELTAKFIRRLKSHLKDVWIQRIPAGAPAYTRGPT